MELPRSNPAQWSNVWGNVRGYVGYLSARVTLNERRNITYVRAYKKAQPVMCRFICSRQMIKVLRRYFHGNDDHSAQSVFNGRQRPFRGAGELCHDAGIATKNGPFCYILSAKEARRPCSFCGQSNGGEPFRRRRRQWFLAAVHRLLFFSPATCGSFAAITHSRRDYILSETQHPRESASSDRVTRLYILRSPQGT